MLNKKFFTQLKEDFKTSEIERRQIISRSNSILHDAKRSIFSLHRQEINKAKESIIDIEKRLKEMRTKFGFDRLEKEGSYKAGVEEYVEAKMFFLVLSGKKIDKVSGLKYDIDGVDKFIKEMGIKPTEELKLKINKKDLPQEDMELVVLEMVN